MFKHLLIATDGSERSEHAGRSAIALAKSLGARVTGLSVSLPYRVFTTEYVMISDTEDTYKRECGNRAERYLGVIRKSADAAGVACEQVHAFNEQAHAAIIETAEQRGCDLICMASHGRKGLGALVLGSVTTKVLTHSRVPVLVWR
jgi:nucleotide-binding universal stress UspA family protein